MKKKTNAASRLIEEIQCQVPKLKSIIQKQINKLHKASANVLICGPTGVGKSTIINKVFRERIATTGVGKPVSKNITKYSKRCVPIRLFDTPGFEIGNDDIMNSILDFISGTMKQKDPSEHVHIMWYCVSGPGSRFQPSEIDFLSRALKHLPVIIVVTKSDQDPAESNKLAKHISGKSSKIKYVLQTSAKSGLNLDKLITATKQLIPEAFRNSLINAQIVNIKEKERAAEKWLYHYVTSAAITGMSPIPFSDWVALVPVQLTMMAHIAIVYGLNINMELLKPLVTWTFTTGGASVAGRFIASMLKLIPGLGTLLGGVINAAVAGSITLAMGKAYIKVLSCAINSTVKGDYLTDAEVRKLMREEFAQARQ